LDNDEKLIYKLHISGQQRESWIINESGLYSLVLTSTKPEAKAFKRWLTHEVLPAIRRTGKFTNEQAQAIELENKAIVRRLAEVNSLLAGNKGEAAALRKEKAQLEEKLKTNITNPAQALIPFKNE
jgi:prophage antirepressor-like protein